LELDQHERRLAGLHRGVQGEMARACAGGGDACGRRWFRALRALRASQIHDRDS
jgi:hypothetical protein